MIDVKQYAITEWNNTNINFWNISKCAGTSIKNALSIKENFANKIDTTKHENIHNNNFIKYISPDTALSNKKENVAVIRHPYDRVISLYRDFSLKRQRTIPVYNRKVDETKIKNFDYFVKIYIEEGSDSDNIHLRSLNWSLCKNKNILIDRIYKFDRLKDFFKDYKLEYINRNKSTVCNIDLSKHNKEIIFNRYKDDFEIFGFDYG